MWDSVACVLAIVSGVLGSYSDIINLFCGSASRRLVCYVVKLTASTCWTSEGSAYWAATAEEDIMR